MIVGVVDWAVEESHKSFRLGTGEVGTSQPGLIFRFISESRGRGRIGVMVFCTQLIILQFTSEG